MTLALSFVPKLAKKARLRFDRHQKQHMLVYPERGLLLNDSAAAIAVRCDGTRTLTTIVEELVGEFHASASDRETLQSDVLTFVTELRDKGLLEL